MLEKLRFRLFQEYSSLPLAAFRILFGVIMFLSILRFMAKGWVNELYVAPQFFFTYYGFEWVKPLGSVGMHVVFIVMALCFLLVSIGLFYRLSITTAFFLFTYVELIDKANYLNHYYFVSLVCFLLIFVPANRAVSLDIRRKPNLYLAKVPRWTVFIFQFQLALVYFFAGLAKLNTDWMFEAMPMKIWLSAFMDFPLIGPLLANAGTAYFFSWTGAIYDLSIPFLLFFEKTRKWAYFFVVSFHLLTAFFFPIGMFPFIMILSTLIFFPPQFHEKWLHRFRLLSKTHFNFLIPAAKRSWSHKAWLLFILPFLLFQLLMPLRFLAYPGNLYWTEQGYRFSWRVMLMEKAGYAIFHLRDPASGRHWEAKNYNYLTPNQEKMMATQPDMILQFAHFLASEYHEKGMDSVTINVENYVTLNGRKSRLMIDPDIDLSKEKESFLPKRWILPFDQK